ncbi:monoamine oxidase [Planoprotostelium fungivorum]|uniref:Monoamine oxidase n=1 Tax=Planoprotostelium fungivorum TaxID=1890364 RepID=A0A2P6NZL5_9EUKA|nr:monoamine oxidase [Planoprotostelium fungivorum]
MSVKTVAIIGAGMSGLTCARVLSEKMGQGVKIIVLEAYKTIGGRTRTHHFDDGSSIDLGASWIHGSEGNPMMDLATRYQVELSPLSAEDAVFEYTFDVDDFAPIPIVMDGEHLTSSRQHLIISSDADRLLRNLCMVKLNHFEGYEGAMLNQVSAKNHHLYELFPGEDRYVLGGYDIILEGQKRDVLMNSPDSVVLTGHSVDNIKKVERSGKILVSGSSMNSPFRYEVDAAVVTASLGALRSAAIKFTPQLPTEKTRVIKKRGFGLINKVFLEFTEAFWEPCGCWISYSCDNRRESATFCNLNFYGHKKNILCAFYLGQAAKEIEIESEDETTRRALDVLSMHWGEKVEKTFLRAVRTAWYSDPQALGAYSFTATDDVANDIEELARPLEWGVFFAGEATETHHFSTAHGALMSGEREATNVYQFLSKTIDHTG